MVQQDKPTDLNDAQSYELAVNFLEDHIELCKEMLKGIEDIPEDTLNLTELKYELTVSKLSTTKALSILMEYGESHA